MDRGTLWLVASCEESDCSWYRARIRNGKASETAIYEDMTDHIDEELHVCKIDRHLRQ